MSVILATLVATLMVAAGETRAHVPIVPFHTEVHFVRGSSRDSRIADIFATSGKKAYVLSFHSEYMSHGRYLLGVDLVLREADDHDSEHNLLDPQGNWHGIRPDTFAATDLARGPQNSAFGTDGKITIESKGIVVNVRILSANVKPLPQDVEQHLRNTTPQLE